MTKAKKKKKPSKQIKQNKINADIAIVLMIVISILLAVLIYTESGYIGGILSPMLGGIFGFMKYIIPIGTFGIAIYLAYDDKKYITSKLIQYIAILVCIATVMNIYQISIGNINPDQEFGELMRNSV